MISGSASLTNSPPTTGIDVGKLAARVHRLQEREVVPLPRRVVVGAERRRHVHDAAAVVRRHEVLADDHLVLRPPGYSQPVERAAVAPPDELRAASSAARSPSDSS